MSKQLDALQAIMPQSEQGNFYVKDSIGVPHPYCIGPRHVTHAADHFGGMLSEAAIEGAERNGAKCETCKGKLTYKQHEQAVLIGCKADMDDGNGKAVPELHQFLLALKPLVEASNYFVGFAFLDERGK